MSDPDPRSTRPLTPGEEQLIAAARKRADYLYRGDDVPHHSCGVTLATTFGVPAGSYSPLRRGGLTGQGECGAIKGGEMVLGEILGESDPLAPAPPAWGAAARFYREAWKSRLDLGEGGQAGSHVCDDLLAPLGDFDSPDRKAYCTRLSSETAGLVAETLIRFDATFEITE